MDNSIMKLRRFFRDPRFRFGYLSRLGLLNLMSDEHYIEKEFFLKFGYELDLDKPVTFNEKLQWLKIHDRKEIYTTMVDKAKVKDYIAEIIGINHIIPTIGVYENFDEINFDSLPDKFVMKCTHDSGGIVICKNKATFDKDAAKKKINKYLKRRFYYDHREWPYKNVKPRIIIEKFMGGDNDEELTDYKFMCFNGVAKYIFTCTERFSKGLKVTFFDLKWNKMPFERHYPSSKANIKKPKRIREMIELSEKIANNIPFVRVDWYDINDEIYFGECTFFPGAGLEEFSPKKWDKKLGDLIDLSKVEK